jgi:hypothetical protein
MKTLDNAKRKQVIASLVEGNSMVTFGLGCLWMQIQSLFRVGWSVRAEAAHEFISDLAGCLATKVQLTTDGHHRYLEAAEDAFGGNIDYAMLIKIYANSGSKKDETRYSPAAGLPNPEQISTSYIERQNLTMRMGMRRFTRLTNGFSKKVENHAHAIALHYMYYNFVRIHKSLRCTPAMAAGVTNRLWDIEDIVNLLPEPVAKERGPIKKTNSN